jgi:hypothetical protein
LSIFLKLLLKAINLAPHSIKERFINHDVFIECIFDEITGVLKILFKNKIRVLFNKKTSFKKKILSIFKIQLNCKAS